jgi:hypothetical protein
LIYWIIRHYQYLTVHVLKLNLSSSETTGKQRNGDGGDSGTLTALPTNSQEIMGREVSNRYRIFEVGDEIVLRLRSKL